MWMFIGLGAVWNWFFGWGGIGLTTTIVASLVAFFLPPILTAVIPGLRRFAIEVALVAGFLTFSSGYFFTNGANYVQGKWDAARQLAADNANKSREDAEQSVPQIEDAKSDVPVPPSKPGRGPRWLRHDGRDIYDRDQR
jgi:hypothetical protein